jgi:multidrug efflux system outer membrane protein
MSATSAKGWIYNKFVIAFSIHDLLLFFQIQRYRHLFLIRLLTLFLSALVISACHTIDPVARPDVPLTSGWNASTSATDVSPINSDWWKNFNSPELNRLIDMALAQSPDLNIAAERVIQAELQMNIADASLFPSLNVNTSSGSNRGRNENEIEWQSNDTSRVSLGASYEVDLWGRVSASRAAANASFNASQFDYESARLSLTGGVASGWFQYLALQTRLQTARENLRIAQRVNDIVEVRYQNGVASGADRARQRTNFLSQQAALLPLELQVRQTRAALAILLGQIPQGFALRDENLLQLTIPELNAGLPVDVIARRPDIASSEAQLQVADADVSAARAALLPSVQLTASAGRAASALFSLSNPTDTTGWSVSLAQSLFDGGRLRSQKKISESRRIVLIEQYRQTIYTALQEVDDALDRTRMNALQEQSQAEIVAQAELTLALTEVRYREGSDDVLALLDAQRSLFQAKDQLAILRQTRLNVAVDLYKALGGGWRNL